MKLKGDLEQKSAVHCLAVFTLLPTYLKDFSFRFISWWAFHSVSSSLLLQTALRQKFAGRKTLCFALPYWFENIQRQEILLWLDYSQKACRDLSDFEGREVTYWEDSDKITQQMGLHGNGLPACPVTLMLSPKPVAVTSSSDFRERAILLTANSPSGDPPFCLKSFLPHFVSRVTLTDCLSAGLRTPWAANV